MTQDRFRLVEDSEILKKEIMRICSQYGLFYITVEGEAVLWSQAHFEWLLAVYRSMGRTAKRKRLEKKVQRLNLLLLQIAAGEKVA